MEPKLNSYFSAHIKAFIKKVVHKYIRVEDSVYFEQMLFAAARSIAASGPHREWETGNTPLIKAGDLRVGFFGNLANNNYNAVRCMRHNNYQADLIIDEVEIDKYIMSRPFWEEVDCSVENIDEAAEVGSNWRGPDWIVKADFQCDIASKYQSYATWKDVADLYKKKFGIILPPDLALILTQYMGYWDYIKRFSEYDICFFSAGAIPLSVFCPRPFVILPVGSDVFNFPLHETVNGFLHRAAYRRADRIISPRAYRNELERLEVLYKTSWMTCVNGYPSDHPKFFADSIDSIRKSWQHKVGGDYFILGICRQSWVWKGNDKLLDAFAKLDNADARLVLMNWGEDIEESKRRIEKLGIENRVIWEKLSSRPRLQRIIAAADVVCDQFAMRGFGTSVAEALYVGRPVIIRFFAEHDCFDHHEPPPFLHAETADEIVYQLRLMESLELRAKIGKQGHEWAMQARYSPNLPHRLMDELLSVVNSRL